jgi:hypothetical protein
VRYIVVFASMARIRFRFCLVFFLALVLNGCFQVLGSFKLDVVVDAPDLLYSVLGIAVESVMIIGCIAVAVCMVVVWRVVRAALLYFILTLVVFLTEVIILLYWVGTIQTLAISPEMFYIFWYLTWIMFLVFFLLFLT